MAKWGMERFEQTDTHSENAIDKSSQKQRKSKNSSIYANPIISDALFTTQKVYYAVPFKKEKPVSEVYPVIDNDLARDNVENDLTAADIQDL